MQILCKYYTIENINIYIDDKMALVYRPLGLSWKVQLMIFDFGTNFGTILGFYIFCGGNHPLKKKITFVLGL